MATLAVLLCVAGVVLLGLLLRGLVGRRDPHSPVVAVVNGECIDAAMVDQLAVLCDESDRTLCRQYLVQALVDLRLAQQADRRLIDFDHLTVLAREVDRGGSIHRALTELLCSPLIVPGLADLDARSVPDWEVQDYYDRHPSAFFVPQSTSLRHIFLPFGNERDRAHEEISQIRARLTSGEEFAAAARRFSKGPRAEEGGRWEFQGEVAFIAPLPEVIERLRIGEISPIVETKRGFHLVVVESRSRARVPPLDEVAEEVRRLMLKQKRREVVSSFWAALQTKAKVTLHLERLEGD